MIKEYINSSDFSIEKALTEVINDKMPFNKLLGFKVNKISENSVSIIFDMSENLVGNFHHKILHGGVISSVLDLVGGFNAFLALFKKVYTSLESNERVEKLSNIATIDLRVDYLRPGKGNFFLADAAILRLGNKIAVTRMELTNDKDELIALGTGTYSVG